MDSGTFEGDDSAGADSGRRRGGMGGGTGGSSFRRKLTIDDTEEDPTRDTNTHKHADDITTAVTRDTEDAGKHVT